MYRVFENRIIKEFTTEHNADISATLLSKDHYAKRNDSYGLMIRRKYEILESDRGRDKTRRRQDDKEERKQFSL